MKPDAGIDSIDVFGAETENRTTDLLFNDDSDEMDGLHITDEDTDAEILSGKAAEQDIFESEDSDKGEDE